MQWTLTAPQLCSVNRSSISLTQFQLWPPLLNSSQTISALRNFRNFRDFFKQFSNLFHLTSAQLFSTLPCSTQLFSTTLTSSWLFSTRLNSSHLLARLQPFPPLLTSAQLISLLSQLISTFLTFSTLANSSQLFIPPVTEMLTHRASLYMEKNLHTASSYTEKLWHLHAESFTHSTFLHREACTHSKLSRIEAFTQESFYTQAFTQRSFYTKQAFAHNKLLHSKLLHREAFT